jgi:hypothetical protein
MRCLRTPFREETVFPYGRGCTGPTTFRQPVFSGKVVGFRFHGSGFFIEVRHQDGDVFESWVLRSNGAPHFVPLLPKPQPLLTTPDGGCWLTDDLD